jgi:hypothetical protein
MKNRPTQTRRLNLRTVITTTAALALAAGLRSFSPYNPRKDHNIPNVPLPNSIKAMPRRQRTRMLLREGRREAHLQNQQFNRRQRRARRDTSPLQQTINAMTNWQRNKYANWKSANKNAPYHIIEAAAARIQQTQRRWREDLTAV